MITTTNIEGINDLNDMLLDLGLVLGKKAVRKAAKLALAPVLSEIQSTAPVDENTPDEIHLRDSFKIRVGNRTKKDRNAGNDTFLSAKVASDKSVGDYVAAIEFGRAEGTFTKTNVFGVESSNPFTVQRGAMEANPFMANALDNNYTKVVDLFTSNIFLEMDKISKAKARKARSQQRMQERGASGGG